MGSVTLQSYCPNLVNGFPCEPERSFKPLIHQAQAARVEDGTIRLTSHSFLGVNHLLPTRCQALISCYRPEPSEFPSP